MPKEHSSIDETDSVEAQLATGVEIIKLDHMRIQEHFRGRSEVETAFLPIGCGAALNDPRPRRAVGALPFMTSGSAGD